MKNIFKKLFFCCLLFLIFNVNVSAAIRYEFDTKLSPLGGEYTSIKIPIGDDGLTPTLFKYIRLRFETGSGHGDNINVYAIASNTYTRIDLASIKKLDFSGSKTYIIDFKAPNAPARSDADITVIVPSVSKNGIVYSNNNYCIANENVTYGFVIENKSLLGGNAVIKGAFSFEN